MQPIETMDAPEILKIEAGIATVRVSAGYGEDIAVTWDVKGSRFEEIVDRATLEGNKLSVPADGGTATADASGDTYAAGGRVIVCDTVSPGGGGPTATLGGVQADGVNDHLVVEIEIPHGVEIDVETTTGDIKILGPVPVRNAVLRTDVGAIHVENADLLEATTGVGAISVGSGKNGGFGGRADLTSRSGGISVVTNAEAEVDATSKVGDIEFTGNYRRELMRGHSKVGKVRYN